VNLECHVSDNQQGGEERELLRIGQNSAVFVDHFESGDRGTSSRAAARRLLHRKTEDHMSLVRLLGFATLDCGCVVGRYREVATNREVVYVEEKGQECEISGHRRNHTVSRVSRVVAPLVAVAKAS
jgi:hypothetical protein